MNIPPHPYFMIADGTYCHILPDKIVMGQPAKIEFIPPMQHGNRKLFALLNSFFLLLATGLFSFLYLTGRMIPEVLVAVLMIVAGSIYRLYLFRDTSVTDCIERKYISSTKMVKRSMGYATWVIFFTSDKGEKLRRLINIYDTREHEEKAEKILREEGLI